MLRCSSEGGSGAMVREGATIGAGRGARKKAAGEFRLPLVQ